MEMNMLVLSPSRKKLHEGDVFVLQVKEGEYIFGRLISMEALIGPMKGCNLIYIFNATSKDKSNIPELDKNNLLVPPIMTNRQAWLKGYFEMVKHLPLEPSDALPVHCFLDFTGRYYDEKNNELPKRLEPCGDYGLHSIRTIDDAISDALGIPRAPE